MLHPLVIPRVIQFSLIHLNDLRSVCMTTLPNVNALDDMGYPELGCIVPI